ncbi:MAG: hypothetical protein JXD23_16350 [Spirochaetales bacterium]|nr:hypothetical protein [Spirochaetales bacterium]
MKKAILLIAALLAFGSMAFAEYSIGCWGRTVFTMAGGSSDAGSTVGVGWGPNWWGSTRMGVNLSFASSTLSFKITTYYNGAFSNTGEGINAPLVSTNVTGTADLITGAVTGTGSGTLAGGPNNINMSNMYGSCKVIPDLLTVIVGYNNGDGFDMFRMNGPNPNSDQNNNLGRMSGWGLWLVLEPKDLGLQVAVNMMTPTPTGNAAWGPLGGFDAGFSWERQIHNINVAAAYTIPDIVRITAAFMNVYNGMRTHVVDATTGSNYEIYARFDLLAITGMALYLDGSFTGLEAERAMSLQLDLGFGYKIGDLGLYLVAKGTIPLEAGDPQIEANLEVTYNIKPITVGLIVGSSVPLASGANMTFEFQPYVSLDDVSLRIAFDYRLNTLSGSTNYWWVPIFFTFSF